MGSPSSSAEVLSGGSVRCGEVHGLSRPQWAHLLVSLDACSFGCGHCLCFSAGITSSPRVCSLPLPPLRAPTPVSGSPQDWLPARLSWCSMTLLT